jgi:tRNA dimethylallyltransferase
MYGMVQNLIKHILWNRLRDVDPDSAEKIHKNNTKRVIRALEIYDMTGKTKTWFDSQTKEKNPDIDINMITLDFHNRDLLYSRVDLRVDQMMEEGLLSEVKSLWERGMLVPETTAAQAIGYKEIVEYLEGKCSLAEAVEKIKLSSRRYAKRQLTGSGTRGMQRSSLWMMSREKSKMQMHY